MCYYHRRKSLPICLYNNSKNTFIKSTRILYGTFVPIHSNVVSFMFFCELILMTGVYFGIKPRDFEKDGLGVLKSVVIVESNLASDQRFRERVLFALVCGDWAHSSSGHIRLPDTSFFRDYPPKCCACVSKLLHTIQCEMMLEHITLYHVSIDIFISTNVFLLNFVGHCRMYRLMSSGRNSEFNSLRVPNVTA